jgi:hypothetical protein
LETKRKMLMMLVPSSASDISKGEYMAIAQPFLLPLPHVQCDSHPSF